MARLQRRRFNETEDVRTTPRGRVEVVELDDRVVARMVWSPGWRWSDDVKPIAGTQSCQSHHVAIALSGQLRVQMTDGIEMEINGGEVFEIPPGHDAWVVGDEPFVSVDFESMRGFAKSDPGVVRRALATVLMTDIVDSTALAVAHGPARWQELVGRHNELSERIIDRHQGRLIKTTGDGVIGLFDSAERAVRAAISIAGSVEAVGLQVRAAVQTGEVEMSAGDVRGIVVHTVARMMSLAGGGEVVISATVRDLLDATDLDFEDFGLHELKGLPGQRQLYRHSVGAAAGRAVASVTPTATATAT
ncbi:MAG: adenylate/guanylate cyclase domain-containing protein [Candidatus Limnocylindrales bacterium]